MPILHFSFYVKGTGMFVWSKIDGISELRAGSYNLIWEENGNRSFICPTHVTSFGHFISNMQWF